MSIETVLLLPEKDIFDRVSMSRMSDAAAINDSFLTSQGLQPRFPCRIL